MRQHFIITTIITALALPVLTSCVNTGSLNILIDNTSGHDTTRVVVSVPLDSITAHLGNGDGKPLILLNEKNESVDYSHDPSGAITFTIPVIKKDSQKNYSLNKQEKQLSDNLFRFRTASIRITVQD